MVLDVLLVMKNMVKKSRSKYFEFLDQDGFAIITTVNSKAGVFAWVPASWNDQVVKVRVFYPDHCDFFYRRVKKNRTRGYITLASIYSGMRVNVSLLPPD
jgi:hypothetical protein